MPHREVVLPDQRKHDSQDHDPHAADAARVGVHVALFRLRAAGAARAADALAAGAGRAAGQGRDAAHLFFVLLTRRRVHKMRPVLVCCPGAARMRSFSRRSACGLGPGA